METRINEVASRIYRLSTFVPDIGPNGFTFNQFFIDDDEPLLFHWPSSHVPSRCCGPRLDHPTGATSLDYVRSR